MCSLKKENLRVYWLVFQRIDTMIQRGDMMDGTDEKLFDSAFDLKMLISPKENFEK